MSASGPSGPLVYSLYKERQGIKSCLKSQSQDTALIYGLLIKFAEIMALGPKMVCEQCFTPTL